MHNLYQWFQEISPIIPYAVATPTITSETPLSHKLHID